MNSLIEGQWPVVEGGHWLRTQILDGLSDTDLSFNPGGLNMSLGALLRELGEIEYSYIQSFKTFKQDWSYHNTEAGLDQSVAKLKAWFTALDADLKAALSALSEDDLAQKTIERGSYGFKSIKLQLEVYLQALPMFFGKVTIFLRAMNRPLSKELQDWIG